VLKYDPDIVSENQIDLVVADVRCDAAHRQSLTMGRKIQLRRGSAPRAIFRDIFEEIIMKLTHSAFGGLLLSSLLVSSAQADCLPGFIANPLCDLGVVAQQTANALNLIAAGLVHPVGLAVNDRCVTPVDFFLGPINPVGAACRAITPNGVVTGPVQ
jgi:hypothetical protein